MEWGCWTDCSSDCGTTGTKARVRSCSHSDGIGTESCPCNFNTIGIDTCTWSENGGSTCDHTGTNP